jgi:hypothetical protein
MRIFSDLKNLATDEKTFVGGLLKLTSDAASEVKKNPLSWKSWAGLCSKSLGSSIVMAPTSVAGILGYGAIDGFNCAISMIKQNPVLGLFFPIPIMAGAVVGATTSVVVAVAGATTIAALATVAAISVAPTVLTGLGSALVNGPKSAYNYFSSSSNTDNSRLNANSQKIQSAQANFQQSKTINAEAPRNNHQNRPKVTFQKRLEQQRSGTRSSGRSI